MDDSDNIFLSTLSHDVRTALNSIVGYAQMLKLGIPDAAERKTALDSILASSTSLLALVNDVVDFSRLESGKLEIIPVPTDIQRLVRDVAEFHQLSAQRKNLALSIETPYAPELVVDPQRVRQILSHLLENAIKFTEKGGVFIEEKYSGGELTLKVSDTGPGIPPERLDAVVHNEPGNRAIHGGDERAELGLAIVRDLVNCMGGEISIASEVGVGTAFTITFPNVPALETDHRKQFSLTQRIRLAAKSDGDVTRRILVVDDSPAGTAVIKGLLKVLGYTNVAVAENGREALAMLDIAEDQPFDVVLTDLWMPEMGGEQLMKAIRADERFENLPVYAVTADVVAGKDFADGFTGILLKPVTLESLKAVLK